MAAVRGRMPLPVQVFNLQVRGNRLPPPSAAPSRWGSLPPPRSVSLPFPARCPTARPGPALPRPPGGAPRPSPSAPRLRRGKGSRSRLALPPGLSVSLPPPLARSGA